MSPEFCGILRGVITLRGQPSAPPICVRWMPAHVGINGNELADQAANEAAKGGGDHKMVSYSAARPAPRIRLATNARKAVRDRVRARWVWEWEKTTTGKPTKRLLKEPDKGVLLLFEGLSRLLSSILMQMRSIWISLKHFLFKIGATDSDKYHCREGWQTPRYILLQCSLYIDLRRRLVDKVKASGQGQIVGL